MNGIVYDMSPSPNYRHGIINNNINTIIKIGLKNSLCLVFMENLDFKYHPEENDDYVVPDIMVICDRKHLKGGSYSGVPKFIAETLSPSTVMKDRTEKMAAYEKAGVDCFTAGSRRNLLPGKWKIYFEVQLYFRK